MAKVVRVKASLRKGKVVKAHTRAVTTNKQGAGEEYSHTLKSVKEKVGIPRDGWIFINKKEFFPKHIDSKTHDEVLKIASFKKETGQVDLSRFKTKVETVPFKNIIATQDHVRTKTLLQKLKVESEMGTVYKKKNKYYLVDGHHGHISNIVKGKSEAKFKVLNIK